MVKIKCNAQFPEKLDISNRSTISDDIKWVHLPQLKQFPCRADEEHLSETSNFTGNTVYYSINGYHRNTQKIYFLDAYILTLAT